MIDIIQAYQGLILGVGCAVLMVLAVKMQIEENKNQ